jgi:hypothetical protein
MGVLWGVVHAAGCILHHSVLPSAGHVSVRCAQRCPDVAQALLVSSLVLLLLLAAPRVDDAPHYEGADSDTLFPPGSLEMDDPGHPTDVGGKDVQAAVVRPEAKPYMNIKVSQEWVLACGSSPYSGAVVCGCSMTCVRTAPSPQAVPRNVPIVWQFCRARTRTGVGRC